MAGAVAGMVAITAAGLLVGNAIRSSFAGDATDHAAELPETKLVSGVPFPDITLLDEDGVAVSSAELVAGGSVVIFVDPRCQPCAAVTGHWQRAIDDGDIDAASVIAISLRPPFANGEYRRSNGLEFGVYSDDQKTLWKEYAVGYIPYEVIVDDAGVIDATNRDSREPLDPRVFYRALAD